VVAVDFMILTGQKLSLAEALRAARETRALEIGENVLDQTPRLFREQFGERRAVIIADANTCAVAGDAVAGAFHAAQHPMLKPYIFRSPHLYAEHHLVEELELSLKQHDAIPIAVGSGTINDLTKLAAHRSDRPYLCVATAASMDGYTAFGASITCQGSKQTFLCPAPTAVVADLKVICAAPGDMNAWGYADLLAKVTAGADWILADALGAEPMDARAWAIVQGRLRELVADPAGVRLRNPAAIRRLAEGLLLGGFAMQSARSSRPASGAEHQFSHLWDMQHHTHQGVAPSHGFKVGVGTMAITALYECLLEKPLDQLDVDRCSAAWPDGGKWSETVRGLFGAGELAVIAAREVGAKSGDPQSLRAQLQRLRAAWPHLRRRLRAQLIPFAELRRLLQAVGAPTEPEQIGISRARLRESFWQAFCIRRRFTVLDLAVRAGVFGECLDEIFGPHGAWPMASQPAVRAEA
jgi:glycerol-1-phosphate dehydrogenase [NAD(P)+]